MNLIKNIPRSQLFIAASLGVFIANTAVRKFCEEENPNYVCQTASSFSILVSSAQNMILQTIVGLKTIQKLYIGMKSLASRGKWKAISNKRGGVRFRWVADPLSKSLKESAFDFVRRGLKFDQTVNSFSKHSNAIVKNISKLASKP